AFLPDLRSRGQVGQAGPAAPGAHAQCPGLPGRDQIEIRDLGDPGLALETSCTMARLIFSGVTTRLPDLKILIHHLRALIPFFDARLDTGWATLGSRTSDEDYSGVLKMLGKPLIRDFYADTALCGGRIGTVCGLEFFGADHVLFALDAPFGAQGGASRARHRAGGQGEDLLRERAGAVQG